MSRRDLSTVFEHVHLPHGDDGKRQRGVVCRCGGRGCTAAIPLPINVVTSTTGDDVDVEWRLIARKLEQRGWSVGRRRQDHRCPRCQKNAKLAAATVITPRNAMSDTLKQVRTSMTTTMPPAKAADITITREMSRDDRRIIFEKLNEVYVDGKTGYGEGWNDEKVSVNLGVPRAWVRVIRDENFGDEVTDEVTRKMIDEARAFVVVVSSHRKEIDKSVEALKPIFSRVEQIERHLAEIAKVMK